MIYDSLNLDQPLDFNGRAGIGADGKSANAAIIANLVIDSLVCPSDPRASQPIFTDRRTGYSTGGSDPANHNPAVSQGLWYSGSMGPTIPDLCTFTRDEARSGEVCMGSNLGTSWAANRRAPCHASTRIACNDESLCVGLFCRSSEGVEFRRVTDGLSNTLMVGETLPSHTDSFCLFCQNAAVSSTHIDLNTMESDEEAATPEYWRTSGFKSVHPGGANFVLGDASVRFLPDTIDYYVYNALGSRAGRETLNHDSL